ncbi:substrate-binding domain-containing protein [Chitinilyticum piscinae]|uniref:Substrate-binding domain-containing protein n=1 Tax=Chitinilyticum piscinae TaxID=2866724 RepID=A0A8J7FT35_9NEIS|nr:substrate-binding domain-containing protein [Chitinilyticum piscinae]MBE9610026.1 substrate-binding domain-containing protein [Chitinilyticum piscinae]
MSVLRRLLPLLCLLSGPLLAAPAGKIQHVGVSVASLGNPYFVALTHGVQLQAREMNPDVRLTVRAAEYDTRRQIAQIRELMEQGIEVLVISASSEDGLAGVLEEARQKGIAVIGADVRVKGAAQTVLTNNVRAGELVCTHLARELGGKGRVLIQNGPPVSSVIDRVAGCKQAFAAHPGIRLLDDRDDGKGSVWGGNAAMLQALKTHGQIDAVFTINDRQALGSLQAIQKAGLGRPLIGSVDGSAAAVKAISAGSPLIVSARQDPVRMGRRAVELGVALWQGGKPEPALELLETTLATRANASQITAWDADKPDAPSKQP